MQASSGQCCCRCASFASKKIYQCLWNAMLLFTLEGISFWKMPRRSRDGRRASPQKTATTFEMRNKKKKNKKKKRAEEHYEHTSTPRRAHTFCGWFYFMVCDTCVRALVIAFYVWCLFTRCLLSKRKCFFYDIFGSATFADDDDDLDTNRLATAPRMGTSLRTAATAQSNQPLSSARPRTSTGRPLTGMVRPNAMFQNARRAKWNETYCNIFY